VLIVLTSLRNIEKPVTAPSSGCPECGNPYLQAHDLGSVCRICGFVSEEQVFETAQPFIRDRGNVGRAYHSPVTMRTTLGTKKERRNSKKFKTIKIL